MGGEGEGGGGGGRGGGEREGESQTFFVQVLSMLWMLRQTDMTFMAGLQSLSRMDRQMCPLL